jgi:hypothetical protein
MRSGLVLLMVTLTTHLAGLGQALAGEERPVLRVRVYTTDPAGRAGRDEAEQIARRLLDRAGLHVDWRHCDSSADCQDRPGAGRVTLILTEARRRTCGMVALEPGGSGATALVSVPCVADVALTFQRRSSNRSHPVLARLGIPQLLGMTIAHELGHVLGLKHTPSGLMCARIESEEILALVSGNLTFSRAEAAQMRSSAIWPEHDVAQGR